MQGSEQVLIQLYLQALKLMQAWPKQELGFGV